MIYSIFFIEYLFFLAACKPHLHWRDQDTFKLNWKSLSVNYRLQVSITYFTRLRLKSFIILPRASELRNSPSTSCDVAVAALAQAVAVSLPETHRLRGVVTAQQDLQSGEAKGSTDQTHPTLKHYTHMPAPCTCMKRPLGRWKNCCPSGAITHPEASARQI